MSDSSMAVAKLAFTAGFWNTFADVPVKTRLVSTSTTGTVWLLAGPWPLGVVGDAVVGDDVVGDAVVGYGVGLGVII